MKCVVCRKKEAAPGLEVCSDPANQTGCKEMNERIYQSEQGDKTMASKKATGKKAGKASKAEQGRAAREAKARADEEAAKLAEASKVGADEEQGPSSEVPPSQPAQSQEDEADGEEAEEEEEEEEEGEAGGADPGSGGKSGKAQHGRSRKTAEKRLTNAIRRVEQFPWGDWGIDTVTAGLSFLREGLKKLQTIPRGVRVGSPPKIVKGSVVRVKEKMRDKYADLLGADALSGLTVNNIRKTQAALESPAAGKCFIRLADLEIDPDAKSE